MSADITDDRYVFPQKEFQISVCFFNRNVASKIPLLRYCRCTNPSPLTISLQNVLKTSKFCLESCIFVISDVDLPISDDFAEFMVILNFGVKTFERVISGFDRSYFDIFTTDFKIFFFLHVSNSCAQFLKIS